MIEDTDDIARIYNQGILERLATFETGLRTGKEVEKWFDSIHPIVVAEVNSRIVGFASTSEYSRRSCYSGISEFSVYIDKSVRRQGIGKELMRKLSDEAERAGFWKLVSRVFVENAASRSLLRKVGFREVGTYEKHAKLDGEWKDVIIVEKLLSKNLK